MPIPTPPLRRLLRPFLAGVLAVLPLTITFAVILWAADAATDIVGPDGVAGEWLRRLGLQFVSNAALAYGLGLLLVLVSILGVGLLAESGSRILFERIQDSIFSRIPIVGNLYGTSKQLVSILHRKDPDSMRRMRAVFCRFGEHGGCGVLALLVSSQRFRFGDQEYHIVLVPTAPVPVGGGLLFMPVDAVQPAGLSIEAVMSIYVSMGITAPQFLKTAPAPGGAADATPPASPQPPAGPQPPPAGPATT